MSGEKASSPCGKFQANIFNQTKCQNCFKSRELHLLSERHLEQVRPVYGGWLCLAPEGTDFSNPVQRSRKWQRRFFILYEDGGLSFALDELPSTLPQGSVSMALCTDIADAEPRTGQRNALCLVTPQQEIFIRGDNKEIISGWSEQLAVYLQTSRQSQKKRKVEPVASQEPSPAKISATERGFPSADGESGERDVGPDDRPVWTITDPQGNSLCRRTDAVPSTAVPTGAEDSSSGAESDGIRRADRRLEMAGGVFSVGMSVCVICDQQPVKERLQREAGNVQTISTKDVRRHEAAARRRAALHRAQACIRRPPLPPASRPGGVWRRHVTLQHVGSSCLLPFWE